MSSYFTHQVAFILVVSFAGFITSILGTEASCNLDADCEYLGCNNFPCSDFHEEFPGITGDFSEFCRNGVWRVHCESSSGHCHYHTPMHELGELGYYHWEYDHIIENKRHHPVSPHTDPHDGTDYNYGHTDTQQWTPFGFRVGSPSLVSDLTAASKDEKKNLRRFIAHNCDPRVAQYQLAP